MADATGLLLCNFVYEDPSSHNVTLLGVFTELYSSRFPTPYRSISVYALLTGDVGEFTELTLTSVSESTQKELLRIVQRAQIGRSGKRQVHIRTDEVSFPDPGEYRFSLACDGQVVAVQRILVLERN